MILKNYKKSLFSRFFSSALNVMLACEHSELPRASRNIMSIFLNAANSIVSRFFAVITGLVLVILVQQVTNQVKKFAILLKRSMFSQDCRNVSGNDGCWVCGHSVCYQFFKRMYHPGSSANELTLKAKGDYKSVLQLGRSMIEMLGVLAIIAVLSVGSIAGYGKATEILKFNQYKASLIDLVYNFLQIDNKNYNSETTIYYHDLLKSLNMIPENFRVKSTVIYDQFNNTMAISSAKNHGSIAMCFHKNNRETRMSCKAFIDVAYNLREHISEIFRYPTEGWNWYRLYGRNTCGNNLRCLRDMNIQDQKAFCEPYSSDKQDVMWCVAISI